MQGRFGHLDVSRELPEAICDPGAEWLHSLWQYHSPCERVTGVREAGELCHLVDFRVSHVRLRSGQAEGTCMLCRYHLSARSTLTETVCVRWQPQGSLPSASLGLAWMCC